MLLLLRNHSDAFRHRKCLMPLAPHCDYSGHGTTHDPGPQRSWAESRRLLLARDYSWPVTPASLVTGRSTAVPLVVTGFTRHRTVHCRPTRRHRLHSSPDGPLPSHSSSPDHPLPSHSSPDRPRTVVPLVTRPSTVVSLVTS